MQSFGNAQGVDALVRASVGQLTNCLHWVGFARIDGRDSPDLASQGKFVICDVDGNDVCPCAGSDEGGRQAHAACTIDDKPVTGVDPSHLDDAVVGGHEAAAHTRSIGEIDGVGELHEVGICVGDGDILRESAVIAETGHGHGRADV